MPSSAASDWPDPVSLAGLPRRCDAPGLALRPTKSTLPRDGSATHRVHCRRCLCHILSIANKGRITIPAHEFTACADAKLERRRFIAVCTAIILLCLSLKAMTWFFPRLESDERIYLALTANWIETGRYTIQGTGVIEFLNLPRSMYDKPLFHHPPLSAALLAPFVKVGNQNAAILGAWLGHALAVVGVALVCWSWRRRSWRATNLLLWLPVLGVALDPLLAFCSRKLWPDNLAGGFVALSFGLLCVGLRARRAGPTLAAGIAVGLAMLGKLTAVFILPVGLLLIAISLSGDAVRRRRFLVAFIVPAVLVVTPWLAVFYGHYGRLTPDWIRPTTELIAANPYTAREMSRVWHYYLSQSAMIAPLILVLTTAAVFSGRHLLTLRLGVPIAWLIAVWLGLMFFVARGHGMQMRYLTIAAPGPYVLLAALLARADPRRSLLPLCAILAISYAAIQSGFYLFEGRYDEIMSVPEIVWRQIMVERGDGS